MKNIRLLVFIFLAGALAWLYRSWQYRGEELTRVSENYSQKTKSDSIRYSHQLLTKDETIEYLKYERQDLAEKIEEQDIKLNRITQILSTKKTYVDTVATSIILKGLLEAIEKKQEIVVPFKDSTECLIVEGNIHFDGKDIYLNNLSKKFTSTTDIVAYLERRPFWKFWKWFGKRKVSITILDSCGKSETHLIDVKRKGK